MSAAGVPIETASPQAADAVVSIDALQTIPFIPLKHALPTRLAALSMATRGKLVLAIDLHNSVFLSRDSGKHWKPVTPPWPGRAVKADMMSFPLPARDELSVNAVIGRPAPSEASSVHGAIAGIAPAPGPSLSGIVTLTPLAPAIAGATVEITEAATEASRTATTDGAGRYTFAGLAAGTYRVQAVAPGFMQRVVEAVDVSDGHTAVEDLSLTVVAVTQTVTVETANMNSAVEKKAKTLPPGELFAIITDNGERWTSADGLTWKHQ